MSKLKCDINVQEVGIFDIHFATSQFISLTWSFQPRQPDTPSSGWKFHFFHLAVKVLIFVRIPGVKTYYNYFDTVLAAQSLNISDLLSRFFSRLATSQSPHRVFVF